MKRPSRPARTPASLSDSTNRKLNMYALAASAAGVGVLACTQPAEAKIVYTPTWVEIAPNSKIGLDLNHDGIADFSLSNHQTSYGFDKFTVVTFSDAVWGAGTHASALRAGVRIGPKGRFQPTHSLMATHRVHCGSSYCTSRTAGPWDNVTRRYLGLKFSVKGKVHYGWARLDVTITEHGIFAALTGYAYETVPNTAIVTGKTNGPDEPAGSSSSNPKSLSIPGPQPVTLGLLAQGARGLDIWRKRCAPPV
jgi:hypothetical protein